MRNRIAVFVLVLVFALGTALDHHAHSHASVALTIPPQPIPSEFHWSPNDQPVKVSLCNLTNDPLAYNHKLIDVTGFVSHGFEDFGLFDPRCMTWPRIWLEYGGTTASGTMYCCGVTAERSRPQPLVVEDIPIELKVDDSFNQFDKLTNRGPDSLVHVSLIGRFFAGEKFDFGNRPHWGGFGHMGCCPLLAIQQVISVDPQTSTELDYRAWPEQPDVETEGCGYEYLTEIFRPDILIKDQEQADREQAEWRFSDPKRVATEGLATLLNIKNSSTIKLTLTRSAQGRFIYHWWPNGKTKSYMIVVSRPYMLSFYARDPKRVSWVVAAAYEKFCGRG